FLRTRVAVESNDDSRIRFSTAFPRTSRISSPFSVVRSQSARAMASTLHQLFFTSISVRRRIHRSKSFILYHPETTARLNRDTGVGGGSTILVSFDSIALLQRSALYAFLGQEVKNIFQS